MGLRILHTADWHLGHSLHGQSRDYEHGRFLDWLLRTLEQRQADALLIAGDVFDSANPPAAAQAMLYRFLVEAGRRLPGLQMVLVAGNHDSPARLEAPSPILETLNVRMVGAVRRDADGRLDTGPWWCRCGGREGSWRPGARPCPSCGLRTCAQRCRLCLIPATRRRRRWLATRTPWWRGSRPSTTR